MAAALLGFALWAVIDDPYQTEEFRRFHHERLIAFSPAAESYDVVVIGRSALMSALPPMDILAPLARARGLELRLLEIGVPHGTFRDLELLLGDIRASAPDLLVLELTLLVEDRTLATVIQRKRGYLDWLLYRDGVWDPIGMTAEEFVDWLPPCEGSVAERNREAQRRFPRYSRKRRLVRARAVAGPSATGGRAFLRELMAEGGQAAVVSVPRRPAVEREFALWDAQAPQWIGRHSQGVAKVLSTISGHSCSCARFATASISSTLPPGLPMVSANSSLVSAVIAERQASMSSGLTKSRPTESLPSTCLNWVMVPP